MSFLTPSWPLCGRPSCKKPTLPGRPPLCGSPRSGRGRPQWLGLVRDLRWHGQKKTSKHPPTKHCQKISEAMPRWKFLKLSYKEARISKYQMTSLNPETSKNNPRCANLKKHRVLCGRSSHGSLFNLSFFGTEKQQQ